MTVSTLHRLLVSAALAALPLQPAVLAQELTEPLLKLTAARDATERAPRLSPVDPIRGDCEGFPEVIIGATDRDMSRPVVLMHQAHGCSHNM